MSKNSVKSNYTNLQEWLKVRGTQRKPIVTVYKKSK